MVALQRVRHISGPKATLPSAGGVVYWMSRDQRANDNWALLHAQNRASKHKVGLSVIFCLVPTFHEATIRQFGFMLSGLQEVESDLKTLGIPFQVLLGNPVEEIPAFVNRHDVCEVITDFSPLRTGRAWKAGVGGALSSVPFYEVDAHNVVPVWVASDKQEVGARTIRKKINDKLPVWLTDIPPLQPQAEAVQTNAEVATFAEVQTPSTVEIIAKGALAGADDVVTEAELMQLTSRLDTVLKAEVVDVVSAEDVLGNLEQVRINRSLLSVTGAGKIINNLAKARLGKVSERARLLVDVWRAAVTAEKAAAEKAGEGTTAATVRHPSSSLLDECGPPTDWKAVRASLQIDRSVREVDWITPGPKAALKAVDDFCSSRLVLFADKRNDPNVRALSDLSPYLHFGQLSAQRMALTVRDSAASHGSRAPQAGIDSFLEESIVRRELADNFCYYQPEYDNLRGAAGWARETLETHAKDPRPYVYSLEQLEGAKTHEDIWNAAQRQMAATGKMHGFMRMYWAKKILEWSPSPEEALRRAIYLNDRYSLDGRDPNGYVGCGWAIMGVHDMGWKERPIFGKIRYMNYDGCKRKFDIKRYAAKWTTSGPSAAPSSSKKPRLA